MALTTFTLILPISFPLSPPPSTTFLSTHRPRSTTTILLRHPPLHRRRRRRIFPAISAVSVLTEPESGEYVELGERIRLTFEKLRSVLPGGRWWRFSEENVDVVMAAKPVTVWNALQRMWKLVSKDRWVIFAAFSALILTALSEISIPHFLTASIFSAQSGKLMVFRRNVFLLIVFCITSGICRSKSLA